MSTPSNSPDVTVITTSADEVYLGEVAEDVATGAETVKVDLSNSIRLQASVMPGMGGVYAMLKAGALVVLTRAPDGTGNILGVYTDTPASAVAGEAGFQLQDGSAVARLVPGTHPKFEVKQGATVLLSVADNDGLVTTTPTANAIPKASAAGKLAAGWGGAASTLATLNGAGTVVEDPANATATPTASKIPIANASGYLAEGWRRPPIVEVDFGTTAPYTMTVTDEMIAVTTGAVSGDVDLLTAGGCEGKTVCVEKFDSGLGTVSVDPSGAETIDGGGAGVAYVLYVKGQSVTLRSDGTNWLAIGERNHPATRNIPPTTPGAYPYAVRPADETILVVEGGAGVTNAVPLPAATGGGREITFILTAVDAGDFNLTPAAGEQIDALGVNNPFVALDAAGDCVTLKDCAAGYWRTKSGRIA